MYRYKCVFNFCKSLLPRNEVISNIGIHALITGFWINSDLKFTVGSDRLYLIPASQILYIEKLEKGKT